MTTGPARRPLGRLTHTNRPAGDGARTDRRPAEVGADMGYPLLILLTAVLFLRPEELIPSIAGLRLYLIVIALCVLGNLPALGRAWQDIVRGRNPVGVCVLGVLAAVLASNLFRGRIEPATDLTGEFAKVVVYYALLVGVLDTPARLRGFLGWAAGLILAATALTLLNFHEVIEVEALRPIEQRDYNPATGEMTSSLRLCGSGIYNDPNDLCLALVFASLCCGYRAATAANSAAAAVWLAPVAAFGYALVLTQSRGGLLGLLAAATGFLYARYGLRRALPLALVCLPAAAVAVGGRQANIGVGRGDTGHERVMLWAEGLTYLTQSPLWVVTGIGAGEYAQEFGLVAHNSFIHAYVEMGLFGGTAFLAAFYWAVRPVAADRPDDLEPWAAGLRPFLLAMLVGYAAGAFSVSRNYVVPTYLVLGLGTCYLTLTPGAGRPEASQGWWVRTAIVGLVGFVVLKLFTQFMGGMA